MNIGAHKEAAEHFLGALDMQEANGGGTSDQIWSILRRLFVLMVSGLKMAQSRLSRSLPLIQDRSELAEKCNPNGHASLDVFRNEGFDF